MNNGACGLALSSRILELDATAIRQTWRHEGDLIAAAIRLWPAQCGWRASSLAWPCRTLVALVPKSARKGAAGDAGGFCEGEDGRVSGFRRDYGALGQPFWGAAGFFSSGRLNAASRREQKTKSQNRP